MAIAGQLLIEIGANVARLQHDLGNAQKQIGGFVRDAQRLFGSLGAIVGIGSIGAVFSSIINAAAEAEVQEQKLAAALRSRGVIQKGVVNIMLEYSKEMQKNTIFSDEQINAAMRFATSLGVLPSQMKQVIDIAMKIAVLYDKDLTESVTAITKAMAGSGKGFREIDTDIAKLIPTIKTADERFKILNERFSGDVLKDLDTYTGRVKQFQNQWDEFKEAAGLRFIPALKAILWHMTKILKTPEKFIPADLQAITEEAEEGAKTLEKERDEYFKLIAADKQFRKTPRFDKDYLSAMEDINKKIRKLELEAAYTGHELKKRLIEIEWEHYKKMGISRQKFDELISKTAAAEDFKYKIESWQRYNESVQQSNAKLRELFRQGALDDAKLEADLIEQNLVLREEVIRRIGQNITQTLQESMSGLSVVGAFGGGELQRAGAGMENIFSALAGTDQYSKAMAERYEIMQNIESQMLDYHGQTLQQMQIFDEEYNKLVLQNEADTQAQKLSIARNAFGTMASFADAYYQATGKKHKAFFYVVKAMKMAETAIAGIEMGIKGAAALSWIPIIGPSLAQAWLVTSAAMTAAALAAIASQSPTGATSTAFTPGARVGIAAAEEKVATREAEAAQPGGAINIYVYGNLVNHDEFAREVIPALMKAQMDGAK